MFHTRATAPGVEPALFQLSAMQQWDVCPLLCYKDTIEKQHRTEVVEDFSEEKASFLLVANFSLL